jgi:DNA-binding response OmpR family regulator
MNRVMIVDDEITLCQILKKYFEDNDYLCGYAENANTAKQWISEFKPDLIVIDIGLPDMNGIELAKQIRNDIKTKKIPIIIITGQHEVNLNIKSSTEANVNLFLTKPFEPSVILDASKKLIDSYKTEKYKYNFNALTE